VQEIKEPIIVQKNRKRAFWALVIVLFFVPISGLLVFLGTQPGRKDISWVIVTFGVLGIVAFTWGAIMIVRTMRAPWHLELTRAGLVLYTPGYDLEVPWDDIAGIGVDSIGRKAGCVLVFEDAAAVAQRARFHGADASRGAVANAGMMQARMAQNFKELGYHLGVPGRILEIDAEQMAELLARARTGKLWEEEALR
jgi:hypothetical protein